MNLVIDFISLVLKLAIPITLASFAGTISERSGVINIGIEGTMLMGAFAAAVGSGLMGNPFYGMVFALIVGVMMGLIHGLFSLTFRGHQVVVGVGINLFASGITPVLCKVVWDREGASEVVPSVSNIDVPGLSDIPVVGRLFQDQSPYLFITLALFVALLVFTRRTKFGLRLQMIGDNPLGVLAQGVNVTRYKFLALMASGAIAALGGSYLSIAHSNVFVIEMVAGRGFIGMAANIFGGWTIGGSALASLFFAATQSTRYYMIESSIPDQFIQMIPYVATLLVLMFFSRKSKSPEALGKLAKR